LPDLIIINEEDKAIELNIPGADKLDVGVTLNQLREFERAEWLKNDLRDRANLLALRKAIDKIHKGE